MVYIYIYNNVLIGGMNLHSGLLEEVRYNQFILHLITVQLSRHSSLHLLGIGIHSLQSHISAAHCSTIYRSSINLCEYKIVRIGQLWRF